MPQAYQKVGKRDPVWDEHAITALEEFALLTGNGAAGPGDVLEKPSSSEDVAAAGERAVGLGCDDPMVLYVLARGLDGLGHGERARELYIRAFQGMDESKYPPNRKFFAAHRAWKSISRREQPDLKQKAWRAVIHGAVQAPRSYPGEEVRLLATDLTGYFEDLTVEVQDWIVDQLQNAEHVDPWLILMVRGRFHIARAWDARGSGWANTVTPEQWEQFRAELQKAADVLVQAHEMHPHRPEAAESLITVAMGGEAPASTDEHYWFEQATAAQPDSPRAISKYRLSLRPRWGGDLDSMLGLAKWAVETGGFESALPYQAVITVRKIANELGDNYSFVADPAVYELLQQVYEGYAAAALTAEDAERLAWEHLAFAWRAGRHQDVVKRWAALDGATRSNAHRRGHAFWDMQELPARRVSESHAVAGPHAAPVMVAKLRETEGDFAAAGRAYERVLAALPEADEARSYVSSRLARCHLAERLASGEWMDVPVDAALDAWVPVFGEWSVDADGGLVGRVEHEDDDLLILLSAPVGTRYELECDVEVLADQDRNFEAGLVPALASTTEKYLLLTDRTDRNGPWIHIRTGRGLRQSETYDVQPVDRLRARVEDGQLRAFAQDKPVREPHEMFYGLETRPRLVGLSSMRGAVGDTVRFSRIRLRLLPGGEVTGTTDASLNSQEADEGKHSPNEVE